MSIEVYNKLYTLDVIINEQSIFASQLVSFIGANVYESIGESIPTFNLEMCCPPEWLDTHYLTDGKKVQIKIASKLYDFDETYDFRITNLTDVRLEQQGLHVILEGILDFYEGYTHPNEFNKYAQSSEIFNAVAEQYKLKSDIDNTNDTQLWCANKHSIYNFFNDLCSHGWCDETSGMFWCLDREKKLLYKNITTAFTDAGENVHRFVQTNQPKKDQYEYGYAFIKASVLSGKNNLLNYGYVGKNENNSYFYLDKNEYKYKFTEANKVKASNEYLNINKDLVKGLEQNWFPFDIGNFHEHYYQALIQNKVVLSTYSTYLNLITEFFQPFHLAEVVNVVYTDSKDVENKLNSFSGIGIIISTCIHISGAFTITNEAEIAMQGLNSQVKGETNAYN